MPENACPQHTPVLLKETLDMLAPQAGEVAVDGTTGLGGHALGLARCFGPEGHLIGLDRDADALSQAAENLQKASCRVTLCHRRFSEMRAALSQVGVPVAHRILLDLGVSSMQLDRPERGFSFAHSGPLDMRMDASQGATAADLLATYSENELRDLFRAYGEERFSGRIARRIVEARGSETIDTTGRLAELVETAVPRRGRIHPATRVFQALRIAVNDEFGELERGLDAGLQCLAPGGRLAVITFHSLEDRRAKQITRGWAAEGWVRLINKKVVKPSREECQANRRARSAKLRVVERTEAPLASPEA